KNGVGQNRVVRATEVVAADIEQSRLVPRRAKPVNEGRCGVAARHMDAASFEVGGIPAGTAAEFQDLPVANEIRQTVQEAEHDRGVRHVPLDVPLGSRFVGGKRLVVRVSAHDRTLRGVAIMLRSSWPWIRFSSPSRSSSTPPLSSSTTW